MSARTVLSGGLVADGRGGEPRPLDVVVEGGRVVELVPRASDAGAVTAVDCSGLVVAPGFVDIHTHSDLTRIAYPDAPTRALQGVTTEVTGNCGMSPAPMGTPPLGATSSDGHVEAFREILGPIDVVPEQGFDWSGCADYLDVLAATPGATNLVPLLGHGSLRYSVLGLDTRAASGAERAAMAEALDEALALGFWGLSLGLMYAPGESADRAELDALVTVLRRHGALMSSHMRAYDHAGLAPAVREVLELAVTGDVPLQISHLRSVGDDGTAIGEAIAHVVAAREGEPVDVQADAYPYLAGHTTLLQLLPPDVRALGGTAVAELARAEPGRVAGALRSGATFDPSRVVVAKTAEYADAGAVGVTLAELAGGSNMPRLSGGDGADVAARLLDRSGGAVDVIVVGSRQEDTDRVLLQPWVSIASDGLALGLGHTSNLAHPRSIGTFPRAFRELADAGVGTGEIVRKMTSQPAGRVGLRDRGVLEPGAAADVVVFDPDAIRDNADYGEPLQPPSGVRDVLVAGIAVVRGGVPTGSRPGTLLRRNA